MKVNKKIFLGMGTIASVVSPVVAVISCGEEKAPQQSKPAAQKVSFLTDKNTAKTDIDNAVKLLAHKNDDAIVAIVNKAKADIDNAKDKTTITNVKDQCITDIKAKDQEITTNEAAQAAVQALATARTTAQTAIDTALNALQHKENATIKSLVAKAKDGIAKADINSIDNIKTTCITNIQNKNQELINAENAIILATARRTAVNAINEAKAHLAHTNDEAITSLVNTGIANINSASKDAIEGIKNDFIQRLQRKDAELTAAAFNQVKQLAKLAIDQTASGLAHRQNAAITNIVVAAKQSIDGAANEQAVDTIKKSCLTNLQNKESELQEADRVALTHAKDAAKKAINDVISHAANPEFVGIFGIMATSEIDSKNTIEAVNSQRDLSIQMIQQKDREESQKKATELRQAALAAINAEKAKLTHKEDALISEIITQVTKSLDALTSEQEINRVKDQAIEALKEKDQFITYREEVRTKLTTDYITPAAELSKAITAWDSTAYLSGINISAIVQGLNRSLDAAHDRINVQNVITNANNLILVPYQTIIKNIINKFDVEYRSGMLFIQKCMSLKIQAASIMSIINPAETWTKPFITMVDQAKSINDLLTAINSKKDLIINIARDAVKDYFSSLDNNQENISALISIWNDKVNKEGSIDQLGNILIQGNSEIKAAINAKTELHLDESALQGLVSATGVINKEAAATAHVTIQMKDSLPTTGSADVTFTVTPMDGFSLGDTPAEFDATITIPAVHISSNEETGSSQPIAKPSIEKQGIPQVVGHHK